MTTIRKGSCLCGRVAFVVKGELKPADACRCVQCRRHSGHCFPSTDVPRAAIEITGQENVTRYHSSAKVRRGFCSTCGSSLFFDPPARDWIGAAPRAFPFGHDSPSCT
jgi:hypothetical protein